VARKDVMSDQTILVTGAADFIRPGMVSFLSVRTTKAIGMILGEVPTGRFNHGTMRRDFAHIDGVIRVVLRPVDQIGRDDGPARDLQQTSSGSADRCGSGSGEEIGPGSAPATSMMTAAATLPPAIVAWHHDHYRI